MKNMTNEERSALEVSEFKANPPLKYFLYIDEETMRATTWTGETLGNILRLGRTWESNLGDTRQSVLIKAVDGETYAGTYFKSSGNYARVARLRAPSRA